jgi:hypothetical protein
MHQSSGSKSIRGRVKHTGRHSWAIIEHRCELLLVHDKHRSGSNRKRAAHGVTVNDPASWAVPLMRTSIMCSPG